MLGRSLHFSKRKKPGINDSPSMLSTSSSIMSEVVSTTGSRPSPVPPMSDSASRGPLVSHSAAVSTFSAGSNSNVGASPMMRAIQTANKKTTEKKGNNKVAFGLNRMMMADE